MASVLIVDDEPNIRRMVGALLTAEGYEVRDEADGKAALRAIEDYEPDLVLIDLMMPGELDGIATLARIRERWSELPVVMMSGRASLGDAVRATKLGAVNFLEKPLAPETVLLALGSALELRHARRAARALRAELGRTGQMVGSSPAMARVRELIARVAPSDARVLISGESGTGKELVAAAIHELSPRRDRPFVRVNCAAIPRDLVESEMFGHEKGAFTGAAERRIGKFELADTGTLFLDEIGDLTVEAQAKLLRAIEAKEIQRVGGNKTIRVDVRVLAATNRDLAAAVADGTFREDLYFRLNVIPVQLPPLRDRGEDVIELAQHFAEVQHQRGGRPTLVWSTDALARMRTYAWPGNVRELANIVERIAILNNDAHVGVGDIGAVLPVARDVPAPASAPGSEERGLTDSLDDAERVMIADALATASGNVAEAARKLKTDRANLYRRMKRLGMAGAVMLLAIAIGPRSAHAQGCGPQTDSTGTGSCAERTEVHPSMRLSSGKTYNRVEGLPILVGPGIAAEGNEFALDAAAYAIVRTGRQLRTGEPDAGHDARVTLRFGPDKSVGLHAGLYNVVAPVDRLQLSEPEEGLASFLLRRDYLDYYDRHGASAGLSWIINPKAMIEGGYARERWRSIAAANPFTLFREDGSWRANPSMDEGVVDLLTGSATFDTRNDERNPSGGWFIVGAYEHGHSGSFVRALTNGAFAAPEPLSYDRGVLDVRRYNRISPRTEVDAHFVASGSLGEDELPLERRTSLGGPGTIPGYDFRQRLSGPDVLTCNGAGTIPLLLPAQCDRSMLGQLDFRAALSPRPFDIFNIPAIRLRGAGFTTQPVGVIFTDWGRAWRTSSPVSSHFKGDVGAGLDLGMIGFYFAKAVTDSKEPVNFIVRIRRRY